MAHPGDLIVAEIDDMEGVPQEHVQAVLEMASEIAAYGTGKVRKDLT